MWWHELQIRTIRKWNEDLQLTETWEWIVPPQVFTSPAYHGAFDGETVSGEIHEDSGDKPED